MVIKPRGRTVLPTVVCIDVEPDQRAPGPLERPSWEGFERMADQLREVRGELAEGTRSPVHFSWFLRMDPQIAALHGSAAWLARHYRTLLAEFEASGDEVGLHIHPWRWDAVADTWMADFTGTFGGEAVRSGFDAFLESMGRPCRSLRFGDRWFNRQILTLAVELGARFDLTPEPGLRPEPPSEPHVGLMPDYSKTPTRPYRPSRRDPTRAALRRTSRVPWVIPLTTVDYDTAARRLVAGPHPIPAGAADARYAGWVDTADGEEIAGWAYSPAAPDDHVIVSLHESEELLGTAPANLFRHDLKAASIGDGHHAFSFPVTGDLCDGVTHHISVRVHGTSHTLDGCPRAMRAEPRLQRYRTLDLGFPVVGRLLEAIVTEPAGRRHLALVVRSSSAGEVLAGVLDRLIGHERAHELRVTTPPEAIALLGLR